jgi:hypothetical protein
MNMTKTHFLCAYHPSILHGVLVGDGSCWEVHKMHRLLCDAVLPHARGRALYSGNVAASPLGVTYQKSNFI